MTAQELKAKNAILAKRRLERLAAAYAEPKKIEEKEEKQEYTKPVAEVIEVSDKKEEVAECVMCTAEVEKEKKEEAVEERPQVKHNKKKKGGQKPQNRVYMVNEEI